MLFENLKFHLNERCTVIFTEISELCGSNLHAATLLSSFLYWTDISIKTKPEAKGWFYKTATDLKNELGLTRRGYEKARRFLLDLGVLQYRRGNVHGKMHWLVNVEELLQQIFIKVKKQPVPDNLVHTQVDIHNFRLPKWIPIKLWNAYLQARKEAGKPVTMQQKKKLRGQLEKIRAAGGDVAQAIERSLINGWTYFYLRENNYPAPNRQDDGSAASMREYQAQMEAKRKQQQAPPQKTENHNNMARSQTLEILERLKKKMSF